MPKKKRGKKGKGDDDDYDALFDDQVRLRAQTSHLCVLRHGSKRCPHACPSARPRARAGR